MDALTTPNKSLFLSYSRRQTAWCDDLYTAIDTHTHYQRWRDNKIPESADWWDSICLNIEGCYAFVAILTQNYLDSVYCMGELEYALNLKKPVIALMLQDVDYPQALNEQRLQFARVSGLDMPTVINKVLNALNEITIGYMQDRYSLDIHARQHLRPRVPSAPINADAPEEDVELSKQMDEVTVHGQITTRDLMRRYNEEKGNNIRLARDLLNKIKQRLDVPIFFDVNEEDVELKIAEKRHDEAEKEHQYEKKVHTEYDHLVHYVNTASEESALNAIRRFNMAYPDFGDPQKLWLKYILPQPFDWIQIQGGSGSMATDEKSVTLSIPTQTYWISKYPITNAQFAKFIEAGGYNTEKWWTKAGWQAKLEGWHYENGWKPSGTPWIHPRYWTDSKWNGAEQPVVYVSWYEAIAFCLWLSDMTGESITLPTESQWQYAAQGQDKREYPWGNEWNSSKCNSSESKIGKTTSVRQFEGKGDSPFGVADMAGNVWEWCLTDLDNGFNNPNIDAKYRVLRGGSFYHNAFDARAMCRGGNNPHTVTSPFGFRIVLSPISER